ncbi:MAG: alkyl hydroperoxide reductase subunit F [Betaproteobacteria bacterium]|nr:alkyl hydroperoxide reductase subunit F [Betaproteobacteria bacterium]NBO95008.1 alkyl hydroperoxide reductase subunit F [Betaproteobacteria bacterium]NBP35825.1 alkyl hydroperoxide reductase subunit F [Betaproteobacteria bacterium]NBQ79242.1 alkyl hydroperoxide reductase subunit F [Betaproteobacteria bacterium]NBQ96082.1 alkyl hydroperoxide reductase subunit F [Betaproteobacteria bacterium]
MITAAIQEKVKQHFQSIKEPVAIEASLDQTEASVQLKEVLLALEASSDKISVFWNGTDARRPSFSIRKQRSSQHVAAGPDEVLGDQGASLVDQGFVVQQVDDHALRFAAIPLGHEFSSLVLALLWAGGHPPRVSQAQLEQIKLLTGDLRFEVYMSLSCHNCPDVVQALSLMALINPAVKTVIIDGALYQDEVSARKIMAVPAVFLNGQLFSNGRMSLEEVLAKLDQGLPSRQKNMLSQKEGYDLLVVGGGPAAVSAAIYAARKGIRTGLIADRLGGQLNETMAIENFISMPSTDGPKLVSDLTAHLNAYAVDVMLLQRAKRLLPAQVSGGWHEIELEGGASLKAKTVVISTGARWRQLGVPGEDRYRNKGVAYCPHCDGPLFKGKRVAVVGGGNSGVEAAIDLAGLAAEVTLLEFGPNLKADAVLIDRLRSLNNLRVITQAKTIAIEGDDDVVTGLSYLDQREEREHRLALDGVFVQIGLMPNTEWLKGTVELNAQGEIVVNAKGQTSLQGVFSAGDATATPFKQIIIAAGEGAKAALGAFDDLMRRSLNPGMRVSSAFAGSVSAQNASLRIAA